jgi:RNA polymerase sigma factor (sigma-70 family)
MPDSVPFDDVLRQALRGVKSDDVQIFYEYFDDLKRQARRQLQGRARLVPGDSAVAHSALLSLIADLAAHRVPLADVDEFGCPMLWPLLLKYIERHCNKWNKFYRAKKRTGATVSLEHGAHPASRIDPVDYRAAFDDEDRFEAACRAFYEQLTAEERRIVELRFQDKSLAEIAAAIGRAEATVSNRLKRIRDLLQTA